MNKIDPNESNGDPQLTWNKRDINVQASLDNDQPNRTEEPVRESRYSQRKGHLPWVLAQHLTLKQEVKTIPLGNKYFTRTAQSNRVMPWL